MNYIEIKSLSDKTRSDGGRLFGVSEFIYNLCMILVWITAIIGGIISLVVMINVHFLAGLGVALITAVVCFINYIIAVLTTHVAKVLVHTSYSNIGILELLNEINSKKENNLDFLNKNNTQNINQQSTPSTSTPAPSSSTTKITSVEINSMSTAKNKLIDLGFNVNLVRTTDGKTRYEVKKDTTVEFFYSPEDLINFAKNK